MGKKSSTDLSENADIRTVNLHFHRFGRFLRYLKENEAEIEILNENGEKLLYTGKSRDGNPSVESLVAEGLNVSESTAREYVSRKLGIDDTNSRGDKIYDGFENIEIISFYFESDGQIHEENEPYGWERYFSNLELAELGQGVCKNLSQVFARIPQEVLSELDYLSLLDIGPCEELFVNEFIYKILTRLDKQIDKAKLTECLNDIGEAYRLASNNEMENSEIILGHSTLRPLEFVYPPYDDDVDIQTLTNKYLTNQEEPNLSFELLKFRYEVLWYLKENDVDIEEWSYPLLGLVYLVYSEYIAASHIIFKCVYDLLTDIRFEIHSSEGGKLKTQKHSFTFDELCNLLTRYNFRAGLEDTFEINGTNFLKEQIFKFPEPHLGKGSASRNDIKSVLEMKLGKYFYKTVGKDLNYPAHSVFRFSEIL